MSAPVLQSTNTTGWQTTSTTDVTKPTGLAVGDLMIAFCAMGGNNGVLPTGFSSKGVVMDGGNQMKLTLGYKIADSSDVAASVFTFNHGFSASNFCAISRITSSSSSGEAYQYNASSTSNTTTPSIGAQITPKNYGDSTLLMQFWGMSTSPGGISGYAIATSNPSWTEAFDSNDGGSFATAMAYATRPEVTSTGNVSCTGGSGSTDWAVQIISIPVTYTLSGTDSLTLTENRVFAQTTRPNDTLTLTESVDADDSIVWTNTDKNSSTWTNTDKS